MTQEKDYLDLADRVEAAKAIMPIVHALEQDCTQAVMSLIPEGHRCGVIFADENQWNAQTDAFGARDQFFAAMMPTEADAIRIMNAAYNRLKGFGWNDPIYCPKDGSQFDVVEAGSTGIHSCAYVGEWPEGMWLIDGDCPSRPVLYRVTAAELKKREELRERFAHASRVGDRRGE